MFDTTLAVYAVPMVAIMSAYVHGCYTEERRSEIALEESVTSGLTEPASLHPVIDPDRCMGCGSCITACPEGKIIGLIDGKAELIEPAHCIGHGACKTACPFDAIDLVFGSETRGVDIPNVGPDFQTNVPGIYIAGELGGMGLIRNAIEQGRQALDMIAKAKRPAADGQLDVVIVGAGPAGFSASLAAMEQGLKYVTVEQDSLGGTVAHFPRGKLVMTAPATLPVIGKVNFRETTKEALLEFWEDVLHKTGVTINFQERVEAVRPMGPQGVPNGFEVVTTGGTYKTRNLLLAIGRRGTPRRLGVPGEDLNKVVYRLVDAEQYQGKHVVVVGGGDSAIEAAVSIAEEPGTTVTLSYRGDAFSRSKAKNRKKLEKIMAEDRMRVLPKSTVKSITANSIHLQTEDGLAVMANDAVIVCAGGILPTGFLKTIGVEIETKYGRA